MEYVALREGACTGGLQTTEFTTALHLINSLGIIRDLSDTYHIIFVLLPFLCLGGNLSLGPASCFTGCLGQRHVPYIPPCTTALNLTDRMLISITVLLTR